MTSRMLDTRSGYVSLEDSELSSLSEEIYDTQYCPDSNERELHCLSRFTYLATVIVIVCTVVDLLVLLCFNAQFPPKVVPPGAVHTELRSSYINLDVLYSKGNVTSSPHGPIVNHAFSFAQVSLTEPQKIIPTYHTGIFERRFGPVPLAERRLLVTPQISTVAQFRAMDFGMESCALAIGVPTPNKTDDQVMSPPNLMINVYTLPIRERLDLQAVSYASLPTTKMMFAQLALLEGTIVETPRFPCRTLSYHTFYLACSHPDCHLDIIHTTYDESGLFMYQYQTI